MAHTQVVLLVQLSFLQRPPEQIIPPGHWVSSVQVLLQEIVGGAVGVGVGVAVAQTQLVLDVQDSLRQRPPEQIIPDGHWVSLEQTSLQATTGVGEGEGEAVGLAVAVVIVNVSVWQLVAGGAVGVGATSWAAGLLSGTLGATATWRNW